MSVPLPQSEPFAPPAALQVSALPHGDRAHELAAVTIAPAARKLPHAAVLPLRSLGGTSRAEFWRASGFVTRASSDGLELAHDDTVLFGRLALDDADDRIEDRAEEGYRALLAANARLGFPHLLRVWNYFGAINAGEGDAERYRRFCVGRGRVIGAEPATGYAAATAIGVPGAPGALHLHWLAARKPGVPLENPRQVSAWEYPRAYGPVAPNFSRAMLLEWSEEPVLLLSGTASVLGHASAHGGVLAQLAETLTNVETLIARAAERVGRGAPLGADTLLRVYVRHASDAPRVLRRLIEHLGNRVPFLLLNGEICRKELLVEIEAVHRFS
jgi:chorismate lyase/3-hydroxybenzoate synthase